MSGVETESVHVYVQVEGLSGTVAGLQQAQVLGGSTAGLEEKLAQLTASTDKRHTRVETAIYQVRLPLAKLGSDPQGSG
jgi:hypothetical protein